MHLNHLFLNKLLEKIVGMQEKREEIQFRCIKILMKLKNLKKSIEESEERKFGFQYN